MALNLAPYVCWALRDKPAQRRLTLCLVAMKASHIVVAGVLLARLSISEDQTHPFLSRQLDHLLDTRYSHCDADFGSDRPEAMPHTNRHWSEAVRKLISEC